MAQIKDSVILNRRPDSILFVCNHNIIRSPMASSLTRKLFGRAIYTTSAGIREGTADPFVGAVMDEIGVDLRDRMSKPIEELEDSYFDLIVALSPEAYEAVQNTNNVEGAETAYWFSADPTVTQGSRDQMMDAYRAVRDDLERKIRAQIDG